MIRKYWVGLAFGLVFAVAGAYAVGWVILFSNSAGSGPLIPEINQPTAQAKPEAEDKEITRPSVKVYFAKRGTEDPNKLFAVTRDYEGQDIQDQAIFALNELLRGPDGKENKKGYYTEVRLTGESTCDYDYLLNIDGGTVRLQLCRELSGNQAIARRQLEATLEQFESIEQVELVSADAYIAGLD